MKLFTFLIIICLGLTQCEQQQAEQGEISSPPEKERTSSAPESAKKETPKETAPKPALDDEAGFKGEAKRMRDEQEEGLKNVMPFGR